MQRNVYVHPTASVSKTARLGKGTKVYAHAYVGDGAEVGEGCILAQFSHVGAGAKVGNNVKIEDHAGITTGHRIEDDVILGPYVFCANDPFPTDRPAQFTAASTVIRQGARIGGRACIGPGVEIGANARIGMGAIVYKNVAPGATVFARPGLSITGL